MTRYENKEYNRLKLEYENFVKKEMWHNNGNLPFSMSSFCMHAMDLLDEYHIKDIQYRERIKTLKEIIRGFRNDTSNR